MSIWFKDYKLIDLINYADINMVKYLGIEFIELGDDYIVATMPIDHRTKTPQGILHGGASCVLAETIGSCASNLYVNIETHYAVGIEINANHIKSKQDGYVKGKTKPIHLGKSIHVWDITIRSLETEELICVSRLTTKILSRVRV